MLKVFIAGRNAADRFRACLRGVTAIEYGLIAGFISLGIMVAVFLFGDSLQALYDMVAQKMAEAGEQVED